LFDSPVRNRIRFGTVAKIDLSSDPDVCSAQAIGIEELCVVGVELCHALLCCRIVWINTGYRSEQSGDVGNGATERTDGVLAVCDGDNTSPTGEANRWLDPDD